MYLQCSIPTTYLAEIVLQNMFTKECYFMQFSNNNCPRNPCHIVLLFNRCVLLRYTGRRQPRAHNQLILSMIISFSLYFVRILPLWPFSELKFKIRFYFVVCTCVVFYGASLAYSACSSATSTVPVTFRRFFHCATEFFRNPTNFLRFQSLPW